MLPKSLSRKLKNESIVTEMKPQNFESKISDFERNKHYFSENMAKFSSGIFKSQSSKSPSVTPSMTPTIQRPGFTLHQLSRAQIFQAC